MTENTENNNFSLTNENIENWTATQFWEADPMQQGQALCRIILYVNWEEKTAIVETQMTTNSTDGAVWHGRASEYTIPEDTDFTRFEKFYTKSIKPILQKASEGYESEWNGSNYKGRFTEEANELLWNLEEEKLREAPTHEYMYSFDVLGAFGESNADLVDYLRTDGIDFINADLEDEEILQKTIDSIESGDVVILNMDQEDYKRSLTGIQEELREEEEE